MYELCRMSQKCHHRCNSLLPWKRSRDAHPPKLVLYSIAICCIFWHNKSSWRRWWLDTHAPKAWAVRPKMKLCSCHRHRCAFCQTRQGETGFCIYDYHMYIVCLAMTCWHLALAWTSTRCIWQRTLICFDSLSLALGRFNIATVLVQLSDHYLTAYFVQCIALLDTSSGRFPLAPITNVIVAEYTLDRTGNIAIKQLETFES